MKAAVTWIMFTLPAIGRISASVIQRQGTFTSSVTLNDPQNDFGDPFFNHLEFIQETIPQINNYINSLGHTSLNHVTSASSIAVLLGDIEDQANDILKIMEDNMQGRIDALQTVANHAEILQDHMISISNEGESAVATATQDIITQWCSDVLNNIMVSMKLLAIEDPSIIFLAPQPGPTACPTFDPQASTYPIVSTTIVA
ncbi:hypothetical protein ACMFMG_007184 [Clarireedia jacksonii]